jgi:hypothetical protein
MLAGVFATANSLSVTMFTPLSVACADRMTAINNSKVLLCLSSVDGLGMAALKRLNISWRFSAFMAN